MQRVAAALTCVSVAAALFGSQLRVDAEAHVALQQQQAQEEAGQDAGRRPDDDQHARAKTAQVWQRVALDQAHASLHEPALGIQLSAWQHPKQTQRGTSACLGSKQRLGSTCCSASGLQGVVQGLV